MQSMKFIIFFLFVFNYCSSYEYKSDLILDGNQSGQFNTNQSFHKTHNFTKVVTDPLGTTLRIEAEVGENAYSSCPVIFIVQQGENVQSFYLPKNISYDGGKYFHYNFNAARTICLDPFQTIAIEQYVTVTVSTCDNTGVKYSYNLTGSSNSYIPMETTISTTISPTSPAYFPYKFSSRRGKDIVLVEVRSTNDVCMTVSVQSPQCPVADQEDTVNFKGPRRNYWQTMSKVSLMPITRDAFPRGFELVFVVHTDDARCKEYRGINPSVAEYSNELPVVQNSDRKLKDITFIINEELPHGEYVYPVFVPLAFYIGLMGLVLFLFTIFYQCTICCMKRRRPEPPNYRVEFINTLNPATLPEDTGSIRSRVSVISVDSTTSSNVSPYSETPIEQDQIRILRSRYNPDNSRTNRAGQPPCVTDLVYAPDKHVETSRRYYWLMFTIAIFYSVPVFQLLATYEQILLRTGDNDLCYYNYHCAHPLWKLVDFNHIYSNVGYVLLGTFFIFLVYFKERLHQQINENLRLAHLNNLNQHQSSSPVVGQSLERYGAIQNFGIYYSLGFALIMEGVLSAGYHVCPNRSNFQFDTSFMYVMAVLYMVKIYQFRHPVRINASTTFALLAIIAVISVLGLLVAQLTVAIIFALVHMFAVFYIQIYMYYVGYIMEDDGSLVTDRSKLVKIVIAKWKRMYSQERFTSWIRPSHPSRILLPILTVPFNFGVMIMHFAIGTDFASHLLYIFIGNLLLYLTYYILMKMIHLEFISLKSIQPLIYIPLTVILWVYALQYFNKILTSWEKSPAESRQENEECFLMEFYDYHDMWHFLSAGALFCSFMMLLTLEDSLAERPQRSIPVF